MRKATAILFALSAVAATAGTGSAPASAAASTAPETRIVTGGRLTTTIPLETTWTHTGSCGALQRKTGTEPWRTIQSAVLSGHGRATTAARPGVRLQFRTVSGGCGMESKTTTYGPSFVPRVQDNGNRATFEENIPKPKVVQGTAYFGGSTVKFPQCNATFEQTYTGYGFAYVHSGGPWDGIVDIWVDGAFTAPNQMFAPVRYYRQIDFTIASGNNLETHHVFFSGDGNELCDLDAIIVLAPTR